MPEAKLKGGELLAQIGAHLGPQPVDAFSVRVLERQIEDQVLREPGDLSAHTAAMVLGACKHDLQQMEQRYQRALAWIGYHPDITHNYMLALTHLYAFDACFELAKRELEQDHRSFAALTQAVEGAVSIGAYQYAEQLALEIERPTPDEYKKIQSVLGIAEWARDAGVSDDDARRLIEPMFTAISDAAGLVGNAVAYSTWLLIDPDWDATTIEHGAELLGVGDCDIVDAVYDRYFALRASRELDTPADQFVAARFEFGSALTQGREHH